MGGARAAAYLWMVDDGMGGAVEAVEAGESQGMLDGSRVGLSGSHLISAQCSVSAYSFDLLGNQADATPAIDGGLFGVGPGLVESIGPKVAAQVMPQVFRGIELR